MKEATENNNQFPIVQKISRHNDNSLKLAHDLWLWWSHAS